MKRDEMSFSSSSGKSFQIKPIYLISILVILGIITGVIVSIYFFNDANESINNWNDQIDKNFERWGNWSWNDSDWNNSNQGNFSWNNSWWTNNTVNHTSNSSTIQNNSFFTEEYDPYLTPLTYDDVILPSIAGILLCIVSYILVALNFVYIKIYLETKSKYIRGLIFVLLPLLVFSVFLIRVMKSLYFSSALKFSYVQIYFGFGVEGLGMMIIILTILEFIGLAKLLQLSME